VRHWYGPGKVPQLPILITTMSAAAELMARFRKYSSKFKSSAVGEVIAPRKADENLLHSSLHKGCTDSATTRAEAGFDRRRIVLVNSGPTAFTERHSVY
jgi:hypothetical protein